MAHNTPEIWIRSGLDNEATDTVLRRESDRHARRLDLYTDELRRHAGAVEGNRPNVSVALTEFSPTESERIAQLSLSSPPTLTKALGSERKTLAGPWPAVPATLIGPTNPDAGRSIPTDDMLGQYARTLPVTPPGSWYTDPLNGTQQASDLIDQQAKTDVEFQEARDAVPGAIEARGGSGGDEREYPFAATSERGPVNRALFPRIIQQDGASELTMSRAFTLDRTLGERASGAALPGLPETVGPGDRLPRASIAQTMIEPNRGSERRLSPSANTSTTGLSKETMVAVTEELERLRSAARQTADELEKVRGPVPPAFPSRPPVFRDRS